MPMQVIHTYLQGAYIFVQVVITYLQCKPVASALQRANCMLIF